jgi:hypothetical protein
VLISSSVNTGLAADGLEWSTSRLETQVLQIVADLQWGIQDARSFRDEHVSSGQRGSRKQYILHPCYQIEGIFA